MYTKSMPLDRELGKDIQAHPQAYIAKDMFGFEIELEGLNISSSHPSIVKYWEVHKENSLRTFAGNEAIEYTFKAPYPRDATTKAINVLFDHLTTPPAEVFDSYRTSIHVHLNMALETWRTVYNFITLCLILDELLVSKTGDHRIGNNFCLRSRDAEGQIIALINSIQNHGSIFGLSTENRYSSTNFASLLKFGTVEFRTLECTTDRNRIERWIDTLQQIKVSARKFNNPVDVVESFRKTTPGEFLFRVLGDFGLQYAGVTGWQEMLRHGYRLACDFAYCSEWKNKPEPTQKELAEKALGAKKAAPKKKATLLNVAPDNPFEPGSGPWKSYNNIWKSNQQMEAAGQLGSYISAYGVDNAPPPSPINTLPPLKWVEWDGNGGWNTVPPPSQEIEI